MYSGRGALPVGRSTTEMCIRDRTELKRLGGQIHCFMSDTEVAAVASSRNVTRASVSMEKACGLTNPLIIAVGNAPTALMRLSELIEDKLISPDLVIAVPVGFVNVVESKEMIKLSLIHI